jgi:hypothetical protein
MLLRNPQPDPEFSRKFDTPTEIEIPAIPKQQAWMPPQQQQDWTPPRYWKELLQVQESKFERICKSWFVKVVTVLAIFYVIALISVFLGKLFMMVVALK